MKYEAKIVFDSNELRFKGTLREIPTWEIWKSIKEREVVSTHGNIWLYKDTEEKVEGLAHEALVNSAWEAQIIGIK